jgi:hypothetical protein
MTVGIRQNRIILLLLQDIFSEEGTEGLRDEETEVRCQRSEVRGPMCHRFRFKAIIGMWGLICHEGIQRRLFQNDQNSAAAPFEGYKAHRYERYAEGKDRCPRSEVRCPM